MSLDMSLITPSSTNDLTLLKKHLRAQITTGRAANAVQPAHHINVISPSPVSAQTVRRVLKNHSFKAVTKKKKPLLAARNKKHLAFALKYQEWTVED